MQVAKMRGKFFSFSRANNIKQNNNFNVIFNVHQNNVSNFRNLSSNQKKIFITTKIPKKAVELLSSHCSITHWNSEEPLPLSHFYQSVKDVEGIYCILSDKINKELLEKAPLLNVVSTMSVGFDHIDVKECTERKIKVGNTPGCLDETTADLVLALTLATARRLPEAIEEVKSGGWASNWRPEWMCGVDLHSSTVGIIGLGRIGRAVARRLKGFNCRILYTGNTEKDYAKEFGASFVSLENLLSQSDFVIPLVPLSPQTKGMVNKEFLSKMKRSAILINASRGPIVNQDDLADALHNDLIAAAGLDVTSPEPLPLDHKLLDEKLKSKLVILPHIGSASMKTREAMAMIAAHNLLAGLNNEPLPHPLN